MTQVAGGAAFSVPKNLWDLSQQEINKLNIAVLKEINCNDQTMKTALTQIKGKTICEVFDKAFPKKQGQGKKRGTGRRGGGSNRDALALRFLESSREFRVKLVELLGDGAKDPRIVAIVDKFVTIPAAKKGNAFSVMKECEGAVNLKHLVVQAESSIRAFEKEEGMNRLAKQEKIYMAEEAEEFEEIQKAKYQYKLGKIKDAKVLKERMRGSKKGNPKTTKNGQRSRSKAAAAAKVVKEQTKAQAQLRAQEPQVKVE